MKNVFFIVIDSFIANKLGDTKYGLSPTPFLDELSKKSLVCKKMYSQGPHTEAGSRALLTGFDSMDYGGYMHNLYEAKGTYLDVFKQAGYEIYDFFLPYYMYSSREFSNIDHTYFTSDFLFDSVWGHRLSHFSNIMSQRKLTEIEMYDVKKQLELTFIAWGNYFDKWRGGSIESFKCLKMWYSTYDWEKNYQIFKKEYELFKESPDKYALNILKEGESCNLYKIQRYDFSRGLNSAFLNQNVFNKHRDFLKQIDRKQFWLNLKNQKLNYKRLMLSTLESIKKRELNGYLRQFVYALCCGKFAQGYRVGDFYQTLPSIRNILRTAVGDIITNKTDDRPIMLHCHPEELHNRVNYFSFDISDSDLIDREFNMIQNYISQLSTDYKGNILYDCALLYVDDCINEFYTELKRNNLLDNSLIVICADHGSSYGCHTVRDSVVNNCHTENYHIPLIIYDGAKPEGCVNNKFHTSKDILATICEKCCISPIDSMTGEPINSQSGSDIAISEYIDSGCPDIRERPLIFVARNSNYMIHYQINAFSDFKNGKLLEVYDLKKDPLEIVNIVNNVSNKEIEPLIQGVKSRHTKIRETYKKLHPGF